jgi:L-malate glycosyltransferase
LNTEREPPTEAKPSSPKANAKGKIRVAIIVPRLAQLGPVKVMQALVNSLSENDELQIKVFYLDKNIDTKVKMIVPCERLNPRKFCFSDYDIVHTNGIRPDLFAFLNRKNIRYHISTIHNFVFDDLKFTYNRLISWLFGNIWLILWKRADKLVCVSTAMKSYYAKWFSLSILEVIYNGIDEPDNSFTPDYDVIQAIKDFRSKGLNVLGSAGVITRRKGMDQFLHLASKEGKIALVVIGQGKELANLKHCAEKLKITDRCLFCGFKSNAVKYFRFFDFFLVPSRSEGFGLTLIEAVQQRVPVICSDLEVFQELFNEDELTFFKLDDLTSLSKAIMTATETGTKKAELAYKRYLNIYTACLMAKHYFELYESAS